MDLELRTRPVGPWSLNAYVLVCPATRQSLLVDPGDEPDILSEMLASTTPIGIAVTHAHIDHVGALDEMKERLDVPVMMHPGPHPEDFQFNADRWLVNGEAIPLGVHTLRIIETPGHTQDQICIAPEGDHRILVGDTIFEGGPGKTWSVEGFRTTLQTLREIILRWPDDALCYPGHGPCFRLGDKRSDIEAFLAKDHGDWFGDATWEM